MIADDVRREVAAKMRKTCRENPDVSLQGMVASTMNECLPEGMEYGPPLADLIDRPVYRPVIPNAMEGYVFCPQCGAEIGEYGVPNYCHSCGVAIHNG